MDAKSVSSSERVHDCELCIVGAGYAALNALNAAAKYLNRGDRVVVIDKNETWGGQWLGQYDFVRLHQPYRMFTAGDQRWTLERDPSYLATRREVLDHLSSVPAISAGHLEITPLFRHAYRGHRVREGRVEIEARPVSNNDEAPTTVRIRARKLLKGTGRGIECLPPFPLSSTRVRSVGVSDPVLTTPSFLESDSPVYVIGSGKTAMDMVLHLARHGRRRRPVNLILGSGMWFSVRDNFFPSGRRRYTEGTLTADAFLRMCERFDGHNEAAVMASLEKEGLAMNVFGHAANYRLGLLSVGERDTIRASVHEVHRGHLVDVDGGVMTLREGAQRRQLPVTDGSWFINCTSHFRQTPHEPILQEGGAVCAPQMAMGFSGTTAYYVTHLWYMSELADVAPQFFRVRVDVEPKLRFAVHSALMVMANMALAGARMPLSIPGRFQGDFNKWYPLYRRLPMILRVIRSRGEVLHKAERLLKIRYSDAPDASPHQGPRALPSPSRAIHPQSTIGGST
jgi:hypothetical protein